MSKVKLTQKEVDADSNLIWNTFIDIIGGGEDPSRTPLQEHCHYCFRYDSEVLNGGHLQFFENNGINYAKRVLFALSGLGLIAPSRILSEALSLAEKHEWPRFENLEEYVEGAREKEFNGFDDAYYELKPSVSESLEQVLIRQQSEFVEIGP